jgi:peptidoglycan/LPS O-acetylase OafA/YrhL
MDPLFVDHIPESWNVPILITKGLFAITGVLLLIWHMDREWGQIHKSDQRLRYILLLGYGVLQVGATPEQIAEGVDLSFRHLGALVLSAGLVVVAAYSMWRSHKERLAQS